MLEKLPPRERQIFDLVCAKGQVTAAQVEALLEGAPSNAAIRIMLSRLEKKGFLKHRVQEQAFVYSLAIPERKIRSSTLHHVITTLFGGSAIDAAAALIGMSEKVSSEELDALEGMIAQARREKLK